MTSMHGAATASQRRTRPHHTAEPATSAGRADPNSEKNAACGVFFRLPSPLAHARRQGVKGNMIGGYGHIALVSDSEGNMIGLHSMQ